VKYGLDLVSSASDCAQVARVKWGAGTAEAQEAIVATKVEEDCIIKRGIDECYERLARSGILP
jgi:hypothetical protein